jgi:heat shock protein HslJ
MSGGEAASIDQITNINWQWTELQETQPASVSVVPDSGKYLLTLSPDGNFAFTADCNSGSGTYTSEGTSLTLTLGPVTLAECGADSLYSNYISLLGQVTAFGMQGDQLQLTVSDGTAFMGLSTVVQAAVVEQLAPALVPDSGSVKLDTQNVLPAYETKLVEPTAYDEMRAGLPEHTEVTFGDPAGPVLYIIPAEAYKKLWDANDSPLVTNTMAKLEDLLAEQPMPFNTCCMPVLPVESAGGLNDIVAQGVYLPTQVGDGLRFVGRFMQDGNPVANGQFYYVYQGFSSDHRYFVSLFYPLTSSKLPDIAQVPQAEIDQMMQDPQAYAAQKAAELNAFSAEDWSPSLASLDALMASLQFTPTP